MKNNNKLVGRIVVISLTIILGSLTFMLGFGEALLTLLVAVALVGGAVLVGVVVILIFLYLHYLFGNNNYRNFDQYLDKL